MVPGSIGEKELGECFTAPAMLMSEDIYFLNPGNTLQPEVKKQDTNIKTKTRVLKYCFDRTGIVKFKCSSVIKSTNN
jgi:hypothetical protein